jgi:predicted RNase H-like HicB family nuclease
MTLTHLITQSSEKRFVVHSLDFDLVEVGATREEAWDRLALAVKSYVEFGLSKAWDDYIIFPAPDEYKRQITKDMVFTLMPPIEIANTTQPVMAMQAAA